MSLNNAGAGDFLKAYKNMNAKQVVDFPTRFRGVEESLLDLILVNDKKLVCDLESCAPIGKSDHIAIGFSSQIKINLKPTQMVIRPDFWRTDYEPIKEYLLEKLVDEQMLSKTLF